MSSPENLTEQSEAAVQPAMRRLRDLSESQIEWRVKWSIVGFVVCMFITAAVSWRASPYVMLDAARWRNWQASNFTQQQADRVNNLLKEIKQENARKAGEEQR